ncbi:MAG: hypothetical protein RMN52_07800 [Anaerolineae bacterium]|nr:hypothetical protein [Candidatus Roseilinea sp.]MDW8449891.1 hypothetical protein [Anaerolineae bacterium]
MLGYAKAAAAAGSLGAGAARVATSEAAVRVSGVAATEGNVFAGDVVVVNE